MAKLNLKDALNTSLTRTKLYIDTELAKKANSSHGTHLTLGTGSGNAYRGDYGNTAYTHSQAAHAPSNAQKNSDITKAEIEAKLTGGITSHTHSVLTMKNDNFKDNSALPSSYERGETLFFSNNPTSNKFNDLQYTMIQTLKEYGSGSAAWQFAYPYNSNNDTFFVRNAQYGTDSWREWAEVYTSLNKPTPGDIGAASASHGTHVTYASAAPKANGTAAVGTSAKVAREDHVHPLQTTISGNAGSANKVNQSLKVQLNSGTTEGTNQFTFDGSAAKTINITPSAIGAAASSHGTHLTIGTGASNAAAGNHTHNYAGSSSAGGAATSANKVNTNLTIKLNGGSTEGTNLFTFNGSTAKTVNITPSSIGAAASSHGTHLSLGTTSSTAYRGDYGNTAYTHSQAAHAPSNAQKNSDITKAEIEAKLTGEITSHTHNYAPLAHASTSTSYGAASASNYGHAMASSTTPKANGTAAVGSETAKFARGDHVHPLQTTVSGNAGSATKLQNAKNIVIGNKTNSFDGTKNITYTLADIGAVSQADVNNTISNKFIVLTQAEYDALTTKTTDAIYFIKA